MLAGYSIGSFHYNAAESLFQRTYQQDQELHEFRELIKKSSMHETLKQKMEKHSDSIMQDESGKEIVDRYL